MTPRPVRRARALAALLAALAAGAAPLGAQAPVTGEVLAADGPVAGAVVVLTGTAHRAVTAADGTFRLPAVPPGRYLLRALAIGFRPAERALEVGAAPPPPLRLLLEPLPVDLDPVVVTGTLSETRVSESPVKVEVVSARFLQRNVTSSLMESVESLTGLTQQVDCGVCYTNSIRINGMEGPYTAVLIDGAPVMSALATVYGLNGIHPALVERVEIVKGPSSTLYGSEAMGGVVNVITKDPRFAPASSLTFQVSSHREVSTDFALAPAVGGLRGLVSGSVVRNRHFVDDNGDRFSDFPLLSRVALFTKWAAGPASHRRADLAARFYYEDRFGGQAGWTRADRGGSRVYGESIFTTRAELVGAVHPAALGAGLRLDWSATWHDQDSFYGTTPYRASQVTGFGQLRWGRALGAGRELLAGATLRYQRYDDQTPATPRPDTRWVPGVFSQLEARVAPRLTLLGGLRADHHAAHGVILSPRLSAKWDAGPATAVRLNLATGFRVVNLFTEDHAALSGARTVTVAERLDPERSVTATASVSHTADLGGVALTLDADVFRTRFGNKIAPDYDTDPDRIIYANLRGHAVTRGAAAAATLAPGQLPLSFRLGATLSDVFTVEDGERAPLPFAPGFKGEATVSWEWEGARLTADWTARLVGPMALPRIEGRPARSPWFSEHHLQLSHAVVPNTFVLAGVRNLFGFRQADPLVRPDDPFGPGFDTNGVYGPVQGRRVWIGVQRNVPR